MKIHIDREGCIECGACEASCADVFHLPNGEKALIVEKFQVNSDPAEGETGPELVVCVTDASQSYPVGVIATED